MEALLDVLAAAIGALTNLNKLQKTFKSTIRSQIMATTITRYIEYLEDSFLIEEVRRYDIKGKSYIGMPMKYYFMDCCLESTEAVNFYQGCFAPLRGFFLDPNRRLRFEFVNQSNPGACCSLNRV